MGFSYTIGTTTARVRELVNDTEEGDYIFEDEQISDVLGRDQVDSDPYLAAAVLWRQIAGSYEKLRKVYGLGKSASSTDIDSLSRTALNMAETLAKEAELDTMETTGWGDDDYDGKFDWEDYMDTHIID